MGYAWLHTLPIAASSMFNRLKSTDNPFGEVDDDDEGEDVMEAGQVRVFMDPCFYSNLQRDNRVFLIVLAFVCREMIHVHVHCVRMCFYYLQNILDEMVQRH